MDLLQSMDTLDSAVEGSVDKTPSVAVVLSQQQQMQQQQKQQQQKSLTDALNDIIPDVFENLDTQPSIDHELIHSDLFRTAESLISSTIFSMCIDNFASEFNRCMGIQYCRDLGGRASVSGQFKCKKGESKNCAKNSSSISIHFAPPAETKFVKTLLCLPL